MSIPTTRVSAGYATLVFEDAAVANQGRFFSVASKSHHDLFTDADGTSITAHTMDSGQSWTTTTGSPTIESNKLSLDTADRAEITLAANGKWKGKVTKSSTAGGGLHILFRAPNVTGALRVQINRASATTVDLLIDEFVGAAFVNRTTLAGVAWNDNVEQQVEIWFLGVAVSVWINTPNTSPATATGTLTSYLEQTAHQLFSNSAGTYLIDELKFWPAGLPITSTIESRFEFEQIAGSWPTDDLFVANVAKGTVAVVNQPDRFYLAIADDEQSSPFRNFGNVGLVTDNTGVDFQNLAAVAPDAAFTQNGQVGGIPGSGIYRIRVGVEKVGAPSYVSHFSDDIDANATPIAGFNKRTRAGYLRAQENLTSFGWDTDAAGDPLANPATLYFPEPIPTTNNMFLRARVAFEAVAVHDAVNAPKSVTLSTRQAGAQVASATDFISSPIADRDVLLTDQADNSYLYGPNGVDVRLLIANCSLVANDVTRAAEPWTRWLASVAGVISVDRKQIDITAAFAVDNRKPSDVLLSNSDEHNTSLPPPDDQPANEFQIPPLTYDNALGERRGNAIGFISSHDKTMAPATDGINSLTDELLLWDRDELLGDEISPVLSFSGTTATQGAQRGWLPSVSNKLPISWIEGLPSGQWRVKLRSTAPVNATALEKFDQRELLTAITADGTNTVTVSDASSLAVGKRISILHTGTFAVLAHERTISNVAGLVITYSGTDVTAIPGTHAVYLVWSRSLTLLVQNPDLNAAFYINNTAADSGRHAEAGDVLMLRATLTDESTGLRVVPDSAYVWATHLDVGVLEMLDDDTDNTAAAWDAWSAAIPRTMFALAPVGGDPTQMTRTFSLTAGWSVLDTVWRCVLVFQGVRYPAFLARELTGVNHRHDVAEISPSHNLDSHTDVNLAGVVDEDSLTFESTGGEWVPQAVVGGVHDHSHASTTGQTPDDHHSEIHDHSHASTTGQTPDDHHSEIHDLDFHTDVNTPAPADGEGLVWDIVTLQWIAGDPDCCLEIGEGVEGEVSP